MQNGTQSRCSGSRVGMMAEWIARQIGQQRQLWRVVEKSERSHMPTLTIEEAQAKLPELIEHLATGEFLVITRNQQPIARLLAETKPQRKPRKAGSAQSMLHILAEDDEHLQDFAEFRE